MMGASSVLVDKLVECQRTWSTGFKQSCYIITT